MLPRRTVWIQISSDTRTAGEALLRALQARGFEAAPRAEAAVRLTFGDDLDAMTIRSTDDVDLIERRIYQEHPELAMVAVGGRARLDALAGVLHHGPDTVRLTATERRLVLFLAARRGEVPVPELLEQVWGYRRGVRSRTVISTMHRLRSKLEQIGLPDLVQTVPEGGYRLARRPVPEGLIGRDGLLEALEASLIEPGVMVLVGPGGAGKTALAEAVLARWAGPGEATACSLSAVTGADDLSAALGRVWGVALASASRQTLILAAARRGAGLLLLDDCERCLPEAEALARDLAAASPALRIILGTRQMTAHPWARLDVGPLSEPAARALMLQRARRIRADFADDGALDALLERLDRLPLAIVLVASAAGLLAPREMTTRLSTLLSRSAGQALGIPEIIAQTLDRLSPSARSAVATLSLFPEPFRLADAEVVLGEGALEALQELEMAALLRREGDRLALLTLIKEAAPEPSAAALKQFIEAALVAPLPREGAWVYAAWQRTGEEAAALARRLAPGLVERGPAAHARALLTAHPELVSHRARFLHQQGDSTAALRLLESAPPASSREAQVARALVQADIAAERQGASAALAVLSAVTDAERLSEEQRMAFEKALAEAEFRASRLDAAEDRGRALLHRAVPDTVPYLRHRLFLALCASRRGALDEMTAALLEIIAQARRLGAHGVEAEALHYRGVGAHLSGDAEAALAFLEEAERCYERVGRPRGAAQVAADRGGVLIQAGRLGEAEGALRHAVWLARRFHDRLHETTTLNNLLALLAAQERWTELAALLPEALAAGENLYCSPSIRFHEATLLACTGSPGQAAALAEELLPEIVAMGRAESALGIQAMRAGWLLSAGDLPGARTVLGGLDASSDAVAQALAQLARARLARLEGQPDAAAEADAAALRQSPLAGIGAIRRALAALDAV